MTEDPSRLQSTELKVGHDLVTKPHQEPPQAAWTEPSLPGT